MRAPLGSREALGHKGSRTAGLQEWPIAAPTDGPADANCGSAWGWLVSLEGYLSARSDLDAAWLFGSRSTGRARPDSDVDVAVLFAPGLSAFEAALRRGRIADDLQGVLHLPVDVVDIERIAPITFAIMYRDARLLLDRDPGRRLEVLCRQLAMWHDMQPHYAMQREALKAFFS